MAKYYTSGYMPPAGVTDAEQVKQIQQQLTQAGYNIGSTGADGIWGKNTQAAYESYLASSGKVQRPNTTPDWSSPVGAWGGSSSFGVSLPSAPSYDIGAAYDKSAAQYKAALDAAYNQQKAGIDAQAAKLGEQYDAIRNQAYVNARLNAIGNNELLAARGLAGNLYSGSNSGVSETSRIQQNIGMRNDINAATRQEQNERDALALQLLETGYARDAEYARWMADMMIAKAQAEQAAAQQAFENQMALAKMYSSMYSAAAPSGGSSGRKSSGSSKKKEEKAGMSLKDAVSAVSRIAGTEGHASAKAAAEYIVNSGLIKDKIPQSAKRALIDSIPTID